MNGSVLVIVKDFKKGEAKPDKNRKTPVLLVSIAGKIPNRSVLSGTVAENNGFEIGKKYMVSFTEEESNEYGRQFTFFNEGEVNTVADTLLLKKEYGDPTIVEVGDDTQKIETPPKIVQTETPEPVLSQTNTPQQISVPQPA